MVGPTAGISGHWFYIVSTVFVWCSSDLFSVSLQIAGNNSLHNQMPLHINMNKLVFTSTFICFYYMVICPVTSAYKPLDHLVCMTSIHWLLNLNR